jgi:hypothetical protein
MMSRTSAGFSMYVCARSRIGACSLQDAVDHRLLAFETADAGAAAALLHPFLARIVRIHLMQLPHRALVRIAGIGTAHARRIGRHALDLLRHRGFVLAQVIVLLYDFDIFCPSRPGIFDASVSR